MVEKCHRCKKCSGMCCIGLPLYFMPSFIQSINKRTITSILIKSALYTKPERIWSGKTKDREQKCLAAAKKEATKSWKNNRKIRIDDNEMSKMKATQHERVRAMQQMTTEREKKELTAVSKQITQSINQTNSVTIAKWYMRIMLLEFVVARKCGVADH